MKSDLITLELKVNNHPGVMMHVVSLFARRAFNLEGIACLPCQDTAYSRIWLRLLQDSRIGQIVSQLEKLVDVLEVVQHPVSHESFVKLESFFTQEEND
jgi:acetolactate synthase I/III small subunit